MTKGSGIALVTVLLLSIGAAIIADEADAEGDPDNPVVARFYNTEGGLQYYLILEYGETVPADIAGYLEKHTWRTADGVTWTPAWSSQTAGSYLFYEQPEPEVITEKDTGPALWLGIAGAAMGGLALLVVLARRRRPRTRI